eukprot:Skav204381  [mRNA]  locus=scaffold4897:193896:199406:+ [translate_table: standard]
MCTQQAAEVRNQVNGQVHHARDGARARPKLIWEIYVGRGRVSEEAAKLGARIERFGFQEGWDFSKSSHRKALLRKLDDDEPDEVFLAPKCTLWSPMQNINIKNEQDAMELENMREVDHGTHLTFVKKIYWKQVRRGKHAHIEHPERSKAWKTKAWANLPGYKTTFDQCEYGATTINDNNEVEPIKKSTSIQTTKAAMARRMSKRCQGGHTHCKLEGSMPGGGNRCREAENYGQIMARHLAKAMLDDEEITDQIYAVDDAETGVLRQLATVHGSHAARVAHRLHRNLGHPRKEVLLKLLEGKQVSDQVKKAIEDLKCPHCQSYGIKKGTSPASIDRATTFNEVVQADVLWIDLPNKKRVAILSMVDECTRYMAARVINDEKGISLQKAVERAWIRFHGPMTKLKVDEATGWGSDQVAAWAETHDIEMKISPGQVHTRTSLVERRHQLLRRSIQIYMDENEEVGLDGVHNALVWVIPTLNAHTFVNGFTPTQLAMGRQPNMPGLLSDERTKPPQLGEAQRLRETLDGQARAQQACAKADVDVKLRRAFLRQYRGQETDLVAGERCLYWRETTDKFHTIKWKGPAVVVAVQRDPDTGNVDTYWLAHGTVLLRAGKQHVKRLLDADGRMHSPEEAMRAIRQRRVVRMVDLNVANKHSLDELDPECEEVDMDDDPQANQSDRQGGEAMRLHRRQSQPSGHVPVQQPPQQSSQQEALPPEADPGDQQIFNDDDDIFQDVPEEDPEFPLLTTTRLTTTPATTDTQPSQHQQATHTTPPTQEPPVPMEHLPPVPSDDEDEDVTEPPQVQSPFELNPDAELPTEFNQPTEESFEQRRRRFQQQETIWLRAQHPERHGESKRPLDTSEEQQHKKSRVDFMDFGFDSLVDETGNFPKDMLPPGWSFDPSTNNFVLGDTHDFWSVEEGFLVRNHVIARNSSWRPTANSMQNLPVKLSQLQPHKISVRDGTQMMLVDSVASAERQLGYDKVFGKTLFPLKKEVAQSMQMPYHNLEKKMRKAKNSELASDEAWVAVTRMIKKKKENNEADLRESKMSMEDRLTFMTAKKAELQSIFENGVWELETNPDAADATRTLKARFVLKWADDGKGGTKAKARLVLQGFADPDLLSGKLETSSPTLNRTSRQVLLAIGTLQGWEFLCADVVTAFLQGDRQMRTLWRRLPRDACECLHIPHGSLMRLLKPIYGQADAPLQWFRVAKRRLQECGYTPHPLDSCLYRRFNAEGKLCSMVGLHVDDLIISGNPNDETYVQAKKELQSKFNFKHWTHIDERGKLDFCGCSLMKTDYGYFLGQPEYFSKIKPITIDPKRKTSELATQKEISSLRGVLGALQWPSTQTNPALGATVSLLSGDITKATTETLKDANKALRFAKQNSDAGLQFHALGELSDMVLVAMSDASWGIRREGHSQGGYLVVLAPKEILQGEPTHYVILDWRSFRLPRVSRSSLNAESQACAAAMDSLEYLRTLIQGCANPNYELQNPGEWIIKETALVVDAKALYDSIRAEVPQLSGDKRAKIEIMIVKEKMVECHTVLKWVSSEVQYADGMTKPQARQLLIDRMRTHQFSLQADQDFTASKKKTVQQRLASARRFALTKPRNSLAYMVFASRIMPLEAHSSNMDPENKITFMMMMMMLSVAMLAISWSTWTFMSMSTRSWLKSSLVSRWNGFMVWFRGQLKPPMVAVEIQCDIWSTESIEELQYENYQNEEYIHEQRQKHNNTLDAFRAQTQVAQDAADMYKKQCEELEQENTSLRLEVEEESKAAQYERNMKEIESGNYTEVYCSRGYLARHSYYHTYDDCDWIQDRNPTTLSRCSTCFERWQTEMRETSPWELGLS